MKRRDALKAGTAGAAALGVPLLLRAQGRYKDEYRMSLVVPPVFAWGKGGEIFANEVRERTNGRINMKLYPGASLVQGQQDREFSAMRQGIVDVLCGAPINWSGTVRDFGVFTLPFLFPDHKAWDAAVNNANVRDAFFRVVERGGAVPLAMGETGYRQISNSKHPIRTPDDMKGLKVRVVASPMYSEIMSAMGANPVTMSWADAQPALASKAVDGQENPREVFMVAKIHKLGQQFVTKWNYSNDVLLFAIARPHFDGWSKDDQKIVREAAIDAARAQTELVRKLFSTDVEDARALGVDVHVPTPDEMAAWQAQTRPIRAAWAKKTNPEIVAMIEQAVAGAR